MSGVTPDQRKIVRDTLPLVKQHILTITTTFYESIFANVPSVHYLFNKQNQASRTTESDEITHAQARAIANGIVCIASNFDTLEDLLTSEDGKDLVNAIVTKHVACQINPLFYAPVGGLLLGAVRKVLSKHITLDEDAWQDVLDAWGAFYNVVANLLIGLEEDKNNTIEASYGGWLGQREFQVIDRQVYIASSQGDEPLPLDGPLFTAQHRNPNASSSRAGAAGLGEEVSVREESVSRHIAPSSRPNFVVLAPPPSEDDSCSQNSSNHSGFYPKHGHNRALDLNTSAPGLHDEPTTPTHQFYNNPHNTNHHANPPMFSTVLNQYCHPACTCCTPHNGAMHQSLGPPR